MHTGWGTTVIFAASTTAQRFQWQVPNPMKDVVLREQKQAWLLGASVYLSVCLSLSLIHTHVLT